MRYLVVVSSLALWCVSGVAHAVDYQKPGESVDTEQATEALMEQDVKKGYDAVDKPQATGSVDTGKAIDALMK
jgi:hypothetical protein